MRGICGAADFSQNCLRAASSVSGVEEYESGRMRIEEQQAPGGA